MSRISGAMAGEADDYGWTPDQIEEQTRDEERDNKSTERDVSEAPERGLEALASYVPIADADSPNYRHIGAPRVMEPFAATPALLATLCELNDFEMPAGAENVLFGLRGCKIVGVDDGQFHASIALQEDVIDHRETRCVLGVWRRGPSPAVACFTGSTVPNERFLRRSLAGEKANMLPTGMYDYVVGQHRYVQGALRERGDRVVIRARGELRYDIRDRFVAANPGDNIHPSFDRAGPSFSSAGCQTVRGTVTRGRPQTAWDHLQGPGWKAFRARAGLSDPATEADNGRRFVYVLLTGREAALAARGGDLEALRRLRFGSSGARVGKLQGALGVGADERFGKQTALAWIGRQQAAHGGADGIVTPADALAWGGFE